jgi:DNA-binding XRE family transcriptional regulator
MPAVNYHLLRGARDEQDLSNAALAAKVDASEKYLTNVLCGADQPSMRLIHRFARALGLDVNDIVAADAKPTGDPSDPPTQPAGGPKAPPKRTETTRPKRATGAAA